MVALLIKKSFFVIILLAFFSFSVSALSQDSISAKSAVVVDSESGEVLFQKNQSEKLSMASTTKIMTCILAVESGRLDETVDITAQMCGTEGTSIGLKSGSKITLRNLLYGLMLESGNDAADAVSIFIGQSKEHFAEMMNEKAKQIGMKNTNFVTPSGLDNEKHYTTAYDMAILGSYAVKNPEFLEICSSKSKRIDYVSPDITVTFSNHNRLLRSYDGALGIKTGFTKKSGRCLVSCAERNGIRLVAVTLKAPDDWNDHRKMLDFGFDCYRTESVYLRFPKEISVQGSDKTNVRIVPLSYPVTVTYRENAELTQSVSLPSFVYANIRKGDALGCVRLFSNGRCLREIPLISDENANSVEPTYQPKRSITARIRDKIKEFFK